MLPETLVLTDPLIHTPWPLNMTTLPEILVTTTLPDTLAPTTLPETLVTTTLPETFELTIFPDTLVTTTLPLTLELTLWPLIDTVTETESPLTERRRSEIANVY